MKIEADTAKDLPCNERERERLWTARKQEKGKGRAGARGEGGEKRKELCYNENDSTQSRSIKAGEIRERENG